MIDTIMYAAALLKLRTRKVMTDRFIPALLTNSRNHFDGAILCEYGGRETLRLDTCVNG